MLGNAFHFNGPFVQEKYFDVSDLWHVKNAAGTEKILWNQNNWFFFAGYFVDDILTRLPSDAKIIFKIEALQYGYDQSEFDDDKTGLYIYPEDDSRTNYTNETLNKNSQDKISITAKHIWKDENGRYQA
jgi:hypothetical protein